MKKLLIVFIVFGCAGSASAQEAKSVVVNLTGSYIFKDRVPFDGFTGYANEGFQWGVGLEYFVESHSSVDLKYRRQSSRFPLYGPAGAKVNRADDKGSVNYILLGGTSYFGAHSGSKAEPYAGIGLGVGILDSEAGGSATAFAWDAKLGLRIKTSSKISLKLQATIQSMISTFGSDFYYSTVGVIAVPDNATLFQFGLGGGIAYSFGH